MRGTWRAETFDGTVSEGTFNGTMNMDPEVLTWDCMIRGKGVSGPGAGTLIWCQNVKTEPGPGGLATVTGTFLAPHGFVTSRSRLRTQQAEARSPRRPQR